MLENFSFLDEFFKTFSQLMFFAVKATSNVTKRTRFCLFLLEFQSLQILYFKEKILRLKSSVVFSKMLLFLCFEFVDIILLAFIEKDLRNSCTTTLKFYSLFVHLSFILIPFWILRWRLHEFSSSSSLYWHKGLLQENSLSACNFIQKSFWKFILSKL